MYKYTYFQADLDGERFISDLRHNVSRLEKDVKTRLFFLSAKYQINATKPDCFHQINSEHLVKSVRKFIQFCEDSMTQVRKMRVALSMRTRKFFFFFLPQKQI